VKRLVDEAYRTALDTLTSQRETLEKLTADLIEMETMSAEHMHKVIDANRKGPKLMAIAGTIVEPPAEVRADGESVDADAVIPPREVAEG
jgi:hypothetical protein